MSTTSSSASKPSGMWEPPTLEEMQAMLPQYQFTAVLGRGGMGAVYKAVQVSLDRAVAIKVLPADLSDDEDSQFAERFKNEARTMAKMNHPGIVNVFDFGETNTGLLFIVMEFIDGTDISKMIISQGRLTEDYALAITAHVCDALNYAHRNGVVHRDIKPANILINMEGEIKVADFGLAKANDASQSGLTKTNMAMGTPDFVSPEAFIPGFALDGRADLYAVGVMLYQMLTGEIPRGIWKMPSAKLGTDPRFDAIIGKAMQTDREVRYQSAADIHQDLHNILTTPRGLEQAAPSPAPQQQPASQKPVSSGPRRSQTHIRQSSVTHAPAPKSKLSFGTIFAIAAPAALAVGMYFLFTSKDTKLVPKTTVSTKAPVADSSTSQARQEEPQPSRAAATPASASSPGAINLLAKVDLKSVGTSGDWKLVDGELVSATDATDSEINLPAASVPAEYDVRYHLTRSSGFQMQFRFPGENFITDGAARNGNPNAVQVKWGGPNPGTIVRPTPLLRDGKPHDLVMQVRADRITALLDGQEVLRRDVSRNTASDAASFSIKVARGKVIFHSIELIPVSTPTPAMVTTSAPSDFKSGVVQIFGGHRYQFSPEKLNWEEAKAKAAAAGGHLAAITSKEENQWVMDTFVTKLPDGLSLWLGGTNDNPTHQWTWITGEPFTFTAWGTQEPSGRIGEPALCFSRMNMGWGDMPISGIGQADRRGGYLIEWDDASSGTTPPVAVMPSLIGSPAAPSAATTSQKDAAGKATDVLALLDLTKHVIPVPYQAWQRTPQGIQVANPQNPGSNKGTVELPVELTPSYTVETTFTTRNLTSTFGFVLPVGGGRQVTCAILGMGGDGVAGLGQVDSKSPNDTNFPSDFAEPYKLLAGEPVTMRVELRLFGGNVDIRFDVNGQRMGAYQGSTDRLSINPSWKTGSNQNRIYLGCVHNSGGYDTTFTKLLVQPLYPVSEIVAGDPLLAKLESGFKARYESDARKPFLGAQAALNQSYATNGIARARAAAQAKGSLAEVTALDAEKAALEKGEGVPVEDADTTLAALKTLRGTYRAALAKITAERDAKAAPLYDLYLKALDAYIADLTKTNKLDDAKRVVAMRDVIASQKPQIAAALVATTKPGATPITAPRTPTKPAATAGSAWRTAAQYLVSNGGGFVASKNGSNTQVKTAEEIPVGKFDIIELNIEHLNSVLPPLKNNDLLPLNGLRDLRRVMIRPMVPGLSDSAFAFLIGNAELNWLNLEGVPDVTDEVLPNLMSAKKLDFLAIQHAPKFTGKGLDQLPCKDTLTVLELFGCGITDEGLKAICNFKQLRHIRITAGTASDSDFALLGGLKSLTHLTIINTAFGNKAAAGIAELKGLTRLEVANTKLTNSGLEKLYALKNLTELFLNGTEVSDKAAADFQKALPKCRVSK